MIELLVQRILLKLENEDYKEAKALMNEISLKEDSNNSIRIARLEMEKGNFEKAQLALDEFIYAFHQEAIRQQLMNGEEELEFISRFVRVKDVKIKNTPNVDEQEILKQIRASKKSDRWEFDKPNDTFCPACQQDPCMCSDPF